MNLLYVLDYRRAKAHLLKLEKERLAKLTRKPKKESLLLIRSLRFLDSGLREVVDRGGRMMLTDDYVAKTLACTPAEADKVKKYLSKAGVIRCTKKPNGPNQETWWELVEEFRKERLFEGLPFRAFALKTAKDSGTIEASVLEEAPSPLPANSWLDVELASISKKDLDALAL